METRRILRCWFLFKRSLTKPLRVINFLLLTKMSLFNSLSPPWQLMLLIIFAGEERFFRFCLFLEVGLRKMGGFFCGAGRGIGLLRSTHSSSSKGRTNQFVTNFVLRARAYLSKQFTWKICLLLSLIYRSNTFWAFHWIIKNYDEQAAETLLIKATKILEILSPLHHDWKTNLFS